MNAFKRTRPALVNAVCVGVVLLSLTGGLTAEDRIAVVERPKTSAKNDFYVGNRAPLTPSPFLKLPIGSIKPKGWLRKQLQLEADGFVGHLMEISRFLKKDGNAWLSPKGEGHSPWEEVPYWLKGFGDLGYVLGDKRIIKEARVWIDAAIATQREDGYFGMRRNLKAARGKPDIWPNMIMMNVLQSYHEYSPDKRVPDLMTRYFKWQTTISDADLLPPYWQQQRAADNLASIYWLYNRTGDKWLLDLATKIHRNTANWSGGVPNWHNVNISQAFRGPEVYYQQSKDLKHKEAAERNYQTIWGMYGQVPGGMFGSDENCRKGRHGPRQAIETCGMVEFMLSCEMLLKIDGEVKWADRCEDVAFNSLPAATTADFKALRYLTAPNQVLSDAASKSPGVQNRGPMFLMDPHRHRCCQHNMGHGWPRYAQHLWMATPDSGLAAVFYSASEVKAKVGDGTEVTIAEKTRYPFDGKIELAVSLPKVVQFPLYLRVPGWCDGPKVTINGQTRAVEVTRRSYIIIDRKWANGDKVILELPMKIALRKWKQNKDCVSIDRGPLTYSLKIGEKYVRKGGTDKWPAWEIHPTGPWNYGLVLKEKDPTSSFTALKRQWPKDDAPWKWDVAPVELIALARKIPEWKTDKTGLVGAIPASPVKSHELTIAVALIPMGCARLRISAFPTIPKGKAEEE